MNTKNNKYFIPLAVGIFILCKKENIFKFTTNKYMKQDYLHIAKDNKQYVENFPSGGGKGGGGGGKGGGGGGKGGGGGGGGKGGFGGKFWGVGPGGWGRRHHGWRPRYGYNYGIYGGPYYNYPVYYNTADLLCTQPDNNPYSTGVEIKCCDGLTSCFGDHDRNNNPYYKCKYSC